MIIPPSGRKYDKRQFPVVVHFGYPQITPISQIQNVPAKICEICEICGLVFAECTTTQFPTERTPV